MKEDETQFPLNVNSRLVDTLQTIILYSIKLLAILMTLVIVWSVLDVAFTLYSRAIEPPFLFVTMDDLLATFGSFLVVLIAIEIFLNIILYLRKDVGHLRLVVATALMAIARKIIVLDYEHTSALHLGALGVIIIALGIAYWLISYSPLKKPVLETSKTDQP